MFESQVNKILKIDSKQRAECKFKKHFISAVYSRVELNNLTKEKIINIKEQLDSKLAEKGFRKGNEVYKKSIDVSSDKNSEYFTKSSIVAGLEYTNSDKSNVIQFIDNSILIIDRKYNKFEDFSTVLKFILETIKDILNIEKVNFIGLKKENIIAIENLEKFDEIFDYFNLLKISTISNEFIKDKRYLSNFEQAFTIEKDKVKIIVKNHLLNNDSLVKIVLDIDTIDSGPINISEVENSLNKLNNFHYNFFNWAINDKMREILEGEDSNEC